jgi:3-dehydroquinate dehydratase-2
MTTVVLLSGPNLNLLGEREPLIYGNATLDEHVEAFRSELGARFDVRHVQSNHEGELIDAIQAARDDAAAIVINAAAFSHYAWGLHDALAAFEGPVVEVHLSNPYAREGWRRTSVVSPVADGVICGFGGTGYRFAAQAVKELLTR